MLAKKWRGGCRLFARWAQAFGYAMDNGKPVAFTFLAAEERRHVEDPPFARRKRADFAPGDMHAVGAILCQEYAKRLARMALTQGIGGRQPDTRDKSFAIQYGHRCRKEIEERNSRRVHVTFFSNM
jgi:hypothetical protein